jgi:hypothetical protein
MISLPIYTSRTCVIIKTIAVIWARNASHLQVLKQTIPHYSVGYQKILEIHEHFCAHLVSLEQADDLESLILTAIFMTNQQLYLSMLTLGHILLYLRK